MDRLQASALEALDGAYPDLTTRIRVLLSWFGSGEGPWSGFPSYEQVAEQLLLRFSPENLVAAIDGADLDSAQLEGAARLVSSWWFQQAWPDEARSIPDNVADLLVDHIDRSQDDDKRARLLAALGR
jgi:hypothetical protein